MNSILLAGGLFLGCMVAGVLGLLLQRTLEEHHLDEGSRGMVTNVTGLVAAMSALLLGLLVANAQSTYNTVSDEVDQLAANVVELDMVLAEYGPEAAEMRTILKRGVAAEIARVWPGGEPDAAALAPTAGGDRQRLDSLILQLRPQTEAQKALQHRMLELRQSSARARVLIANQANNDLPLPIVVIVMSWLVMLFLGFGLLARLNRVVVVALLLGALSVGTGLFLVLELNRPFTGIMRISDGSMQAALEAIGK